MTHLEEKARSILATLNQHGYKAYFCGGSVRDLLLGQPPKDYDIVTSARPEEVRKIFPRTIAVGIQFGIVRVVLGHDNFEVATFRQDGNYQDGRRPETIRFSDEQGDALRRDFTINGLFLDPGQNKIIDYVAGEQDLHRKIVRTIGMPQDRFGEDHLRLLRAVRFACQLDFEIEAETWATICQLAPSIHRISGERIRDELLRMLTGRNPARALTLLKESGLLREILPEIARLEQIHNAGQDQNRFDHTLALLQQGTPFSTHELALSALLYHLGEALGDPWHLSPTTAERTMSICQRLKLPSKTAEVTVNLVMWSKKNRDVAQMGMADLKRFLRQPCFAGLMHLYRLDCSTGEGAIELYEYCQRQLAQLHDSLHPVPLLTGNDLIQLGFERGPIFKEILVFLEGQQLEGKLADKTAAVALVVAKFGKDCGR